MSDDPPTILACINRSSTLNAKIKTNGVMSVNVLAEPHRDLSLHFTKPDPTGELRFSSVDWSVGRTGSPILTDASLALDCEVTSHAEVGTHSVFFGRLVDIRSNGELSPLLYYQRDFHTLIAQSLA